MFNILKKVKWFQKLHVDELAYNNIEQVKGIVLIKEGSYEKIQENSTSKEKNFKQPELVWEIQDYEYESYEHYLQHASVMVAEGWKFMNQDKDHKRVKWTRDHRENIL